MGWPGEKYEEAHEVSFIPWAQGSYSDGGILWDIHIYVDFLWDMPWD